MNLLKPVSYTHLDVYKRQALRQAMIKSSTEQYFLCDSSKYGKNYLFQIGSVERITKVISDKALRFD